MASSRSRSDTAASEVIINNLDNQVNEGGYGGGGRGGYAAAPINLNIVNSGAGAGLGGFSGNQAVGSPSVAARGGGILGSGASGAADGQANLGGANVSGVGTYVQLLDPGAIEAGRTLALESFDLVRGSLAGNLESQRELLNQQSSQTASTIATALKVAQEGSKSEGERVVGQINKTAQIALIAGAALFAVLYAKKR